MASNYSVKYTDASKQAIEIDEKEISKELDATLFGRLRLNYGRDLNENFLHLLEKFACPATDFSLPIEEQIPDLSSSIDEDRPSPKLSNPVEGQIWVNTSLKTETDGKGANITRLGVPYVYDGDNWRPLAAAGTLIGANWGQIADGETIPNPVANNGYVFRYDECSWTVAPFNQPEAIDSMICRTLGNEPLVEMKYTYDGDPAEVSAIANYLIVGIKDNNNLGEMIDPDASPTPTPTATATPTPSPSSGAQPSVTPTPTPTPSPSSGAPLSVSLNSPYSGFCSSSSTSCTAQKVIYSFMYSVSGGVPPYTFDWDNTGSTTGTPFSVMDANTSNPTLYRNAFTSEQTNSLSGTKQLKVTDSDGNSVTANYVYESNHQRIVAASPTPSPSNSPTPTPSNSPPPTPSPSPSNSPTPTPSPSPDTTGYVLTDNITAFGNTIEMNCPNDAFAQASFSGFGTVTTFGCCSNICSGNVIGNGTHQWADGGELAPGQSPSDYTWTVSLVSGDTSYYTGPSQGTSGNMSNPPTFAADGNFGLGGAFITLELNISNANIGSNGTISIALSVTG